MVSLAFLHRDQLSNWPTIVRLRESSESVKRSIAAYDPLPLMVGFVSQSAKTV